MSDEPGKPIDRTVAATAAQSVLVRLMPLPASDTPTLPSDLAPDQPTADFPHDAPRKYRLLRTLGQGGVGVVYLGHDVELGRDVAVKFLHAEHAGRQDLESRFVEEAQIGGQLEHPGIVPIYDFGLAGRQPFFAMKLIRGKALSLLLAERTSPAAGLARFLTIFEQVCHAVGYAHARGVVHRDLKPANVMIGAFGEVQVVDWGMGKVMPGEMVAPASADETPAGEQTPPEDDELRPAKVRTLRSADATPSDDSVGAVLGTPAYMPPEQARGDSVRTGPWSDVFALGAILCEILTGRPAYCGRAHKGETFADAVLREAMSADLDDCHRRLEACTADAQLVALCRQCLAPSPAARPNSAEDLAARVADHRAGLENRAHDARLRAAIARTRQRQLVWFVGLLVAGLAATVFFMREAQRQEAFALAAAGEADRQSLRAREQGELARQQAQLAEQQTALAKASEATARSEAARADREAAEARRSAEIAARERAAAQEAERLAETRAQEAQRARELAVAAAEAERAAKAQEQEAHRKEAAALRAAQEERSKAASRARRAAYAARITAADSALQRGDTNACAQVLAECEPELRGFEWRHLQLRIERNLGTVWVGSPLTAVATAPGLRVTASTDGRLRVLHGGSLEQRGQITAHAGGAFGLAIAPDGRTIASGGADGAVRLWSALTLREAATLQATGPSVTALAFDPSGAYLVSGGFDDVVRVHAVASGALVASLGGQEGGASCVCFARDHLLVGTGTGLLREYDAKFTLVAEIAVDDDAVLAIASHDGSGAVALGTLDGRIVLRGRLGPDAPQTLRVPDTGTTALAFAPDGATLVSGHTDRFVRTWDVASGELLAAAPGHRDTVTGVAVAAERSGAPRVVSVSPDGSLRAWAPNTGAAAYVFEEPRPDRKYQALAVLDDAIVSLDRYGARALRWSGSGVDLRRALFAEPDWVQTFDDATWCVGASWLGDFEAGTEGIAAAASGQRIAALARRGEAWQAWDWRAGAAEPRRFPLAGAARCVGLVGDGLLVGAANGDVLALSAAGVRILRSGASEILAVAGSADGRVAAVVAEGHPVEILGMADGRSTFAALRGGMRASAVAVDPLGTRLAVGGDDGSVRIVDTESGAELIELRCRAQAVRALAWGPQGGRLVALFADGAVACFDDSRAAVAPLWAAADATRQRRGPQPVTMRAWP